ncbi:TPA: hypothetical protein ACWS2K_001982 [Escherichia coli]
MAFVHGERGISQRVISYWWAFGRLRAIASLKDGLSSDGYRQQLSELPHRHTAAVSKPNGKQSAKNSLTVKPMGFIAYTDQTGNSSKAAYSQVQTVPSHDAQQAEVTTQASLSPPPTTANHPDHAKFERNGACNAMNTYNRTCLPENFTSPQSDLDAL